MSLLRIMVTLVVLLVAAPSHAAATIADRSPFAQGTWWDLTRAGNGFELFNAGDQAAVIWYTFDDNGRPTCRSRAWTRRTS